MKRAELIEAKRELERLAAQIRSREARGGGSDPRLARLRQEYAQLAQKLKTGGAKWD